MKKDTEAFITGIIAGAVLSFILTSILWDMSSSTRGKQWADWITCITQAHGGDASLQLCDETFDAPDASNQYTTLSEREAKLLDAAVR